MNPNLARACFVALLCAMAAARTSEWAAPSFCKGLECPRYTLVKKISDDIELRRYEPASWVSTQVSDRDQDQATRGSFMKLFNYISGSNTNSSRIEMTAPVVTRVDPGEGNSNFTISFYNPYKYQGPKAAKAPAPSDSTVFLTNTPAMEVYVLSYGGWSSGNTAKGKATELMGRLRDAKLPFDAKQWYTVGYDSPFTFFNRHNEVWVPKMAVTTAPEATKKAPAATKPATKPAVSGRKLV